MAVPDPSHQPPHPTVPRRVRGVRWSLLATVVVACMAGAAWATSAAVRSSGVGLLEDVAVEEAAGSARAVAAALDERVSAVTDGLALLVMTTGAADRLPAGDLAVCDEMALVSAGAAGVVFNSAADIVCQWGPAPSDQIEKVRRWTAAMEDRLPTQKGQTEVWFSPEPLDGLIVAATGAGDHTVVHWTPQDSLLRSFIVRLGPRNMVLAFTPTGAARPDVAMEVDSSADPVRDADGFKLPAGRGVGPLGADAFWASAPTSRRTERVTVGVDPAPYDRESTQLRAHINTVAAALVAVAFVALGITLWWMNRSVRRLSDAVDEAEDGVFAQPLPSGGPRETRRIAAALGRLSAARIELDTASATAREDERARVVTGLEAGVAAALDNICAAIDAGDSFEDHREALNLVLERLRDIVGLLHPAALRRDGLRSAVAEQVAERPGWQLAPGPEVAADELVAGVIYGMMTELWHRSPSGVVSISASADNLRVVVDGLDRLPSKRWIAPVRALGGTFTQREPGLAAVVVPAHVEEFVP